MRPEDVLPDNVQYAQINGMTVRKGSVAAFMLSAKIWMDEDASDDEKAVAKEDVIRMIPALNALGVFDLFELKDERLKQLVDMQLLARR